MESVTVNRTGKNLIVTRVLNAPRELVFEVWTDPEHLAHWYGPNGFTITTHEIDVKPGGVWKFMMHGPDGRDYPNKIIFSEVVKPEKLVYHHASDDDTEPVSFHVTVTFEAEEGKTKLTMNSDFGSPEELERVDKEYGAIEGDKQTITRLAEYLLSIQ